jgi:[acyl-carrier-protein] S-malonyltransferase
MGAEFYASTPSARALFDRADEILGYPLSRLCFEGPEDELRLTVHTQPALYVTSCAALAALRKRTSVEPYAVAGHSVGEYAALYAVGAFDFAAGLRLVARRAELMHRASEERPGAMAAVLGLDADTVRRVVAECGAAGVVGVANYNCPGQIVISGERGAVEEAGRLLKEAGAKRVLPLPVSGGFHSALMADAGAALASALHGAPFRKVRAPVVANVSARYCLDPSGLAANLAEQVSGSVRWEESMRLLLADGVSVFLELGCGDVLTGLMKRIDRDARAMSVQDLASLDAAVAELARLEGDTGEI